MMIKKYRAYGLLLFVCCVIRPMENDNVIRPMENGNLNLNSHSSKQNQFTPTKKDEQTWWDRYKRPILFGAIGGVVVAGVINIAAIYKTNDQCPPISYCIKPFFAAAAILTPVGIGVSCALEKANE